MKLSTFLPTLAAAANKRQKKKEDGRSFDGITVLSQQNARIKLQVWAKALLKRPTMDLAEKLISTTIPTTSSASMLFKPTVGVVKSRSSIEVLMLRLIQGAGGISFASDGIRSTVWSLLSRNVTALARVTVCH